MDAVMITSERSVVSCVGGVHVAVLAAISRVACYQ